MLPRGGGGGISPVRTDPDLVLSKVNSKSCKLTKTMNAK